MMGAEDRLGMVDSSQGLGGGTEGWLYLKFVFFLIFVSFSLMSSVSFF